MIDVKLLPNCESCPDLTVISVLRIPKISKNGEGSSSQSTIGKLPSICEKYSRLREKMAEHVVKWLYLPLEDALDNHYKLLRRSQGNDISFPRR